MTIREALEREPELCAATIVVLWPLWLLPPVLVGEWLGWW